MNDAEFNDAFRDVILEILEGNDRETDCAAINEEYYRWLWYYEQTPSGDNRLERARRGRI